MILIKFLEVHDSLKNLKLKQEIANRNYYKNQLYVTIMNGIEKENKIKDLQTKLASEQEKYQKLEIEFKQYKENHN